MHQAGLQPRCWKGKEEEFPGGVHQGSRIRLPSRAQAFLQVTQPTAAWSEGAHQLRGHSSTSEWIPRWGYRSPAFQDSFLFCTGYSSHVGRERGSRCPGPLRLVSCVQVSSFWVP